jgi:hypothetical protein
MAVFTWNDSMKRAGMKRTFGYMAIIAGLISYKLSRLIFPFFFIAFAMVPISIAPVIDAEILRDKEMTGR